MSVFISYSRKDEDYCKVLIESLIMLQEEGWISFWHDKHIDPAAEWERILKYQLSTAQFVIVLLSNNFLDSTYCMTTELPVIKKRYDAKEIKIIPVLVHPVDLADVRIKWILALQWLPKSKPISEWTLMIKAFENTDFHIRRVIIRDAEDRSYGDDPFLADMMRRYGKRHIDHKKFWKASALTVPCMMIFAQLCIITGDYAIPYPAFASKLFCAASCPLSIAPAPRGTCNCRCGWSCKGMRRVRLGKQTLRFAASSG